MNADPIIRRSELRHELLQLETNQAHHILVAEPEPILCQLNAEMLKWHGYHVNVAGDGAAAWRELRTNHYQLLITTYQLPKINGVGLIRKLRAARMAVPVVMVSERVAPPPLPQAAVLQPAATLLKPFAIDELLETVKTLLAASHTPLGEIAARAHTITPALQETLDFDNPYAHWGLND
jgi:DNA-binding response OmpR family regulator